MTRRDQMKTALADARTSPDAVDDAPATIVRGPWPVGIVGLVAGRLAEERGRPALVAGLEHRAGSRAAATARCHLTDAIAACGDLLIRHGGHAGAVDEVDGDLGRFQGLLDQSADLTRLVKSPAFAAEDQDRALKAVMDWASIGATTGNFLRVVARNRRLFAAEDMIRNFRSLLARHRGELVAEVTSAVALKEAQLAALKDKLKSSYGKDVRLDTKVDPSLLGGLVIKVGSRMFDSSLKTKLMNLKVVLKGTG